MALPVEIAPVPLEEVALDAAAEMIKRIKSSELPGFVVRSVAETAEDAFKSIDQAFLSNGYRRQETTTTAFNRAVERIRRPGEPPQYDHKDYRLHLDRGPSEEEAQTITVHHTSLGDVWANLLEVNRENANRLGTNSITSHNHTDFEHGIVDPDVLLPENFNAELHASDLIVFRLDGLRPIAHHFHTVHRPRCSQSVEMKLR